MEQLLKIAENILLPSKAAGFAGFDPFDGLNSRLFNFVPSLKSGPVGLVWIQLFKRSPVNLRPLFAVPKLRNPKGIALFIMGLLEDYQRTKKEAYLLQAIELADWLLTQKCSKDTWCHSCWGYHFDWKARAFFVPRGKPNVITTIYVAKALFALSKTLGVAGDGGASLYREAALDAAHFIVKTLYTEVGGRCFFAYIPGETAFVHNASLWAAAWVAEFAEYSGDEVYRELALKVARQSVKEQKLDGSWVYGARKHHQFIDGFHTGYNLEALHSIQTSLRTEEFDASIKKGLAYYKANFFEADGAVKYYSSNPFPFDMHSVAQAVLTLLKVGGQEEDFLLADKVIRWSIDNLYMPSKQRFVYQKTQTFTNKINYVRWTQAWVYYSFSFYNRAVEGKNGES